MTVFFSPELIFFAPIFFLIFFACFVLCFNLKKEKFASESVYTKFIFTYVLSVLFFVFLLIFNLFANSVLNVFSVYLGNNTFYVNSYTLCLQSLIIMFSVIVLISSKNYCVLHNMATSEFYFLILSSIFGALSLSASNSLISMYLSLELQTIPIYILIALFKNSRKAVEASLKYFIFSIVASVLFLFGSALIYCVSGLFTFTDLHVFTKFAVVTFFRSPDYVFYKVFFYLGVALILFTIFFKLGVAPFYFWLPEVFDGAPVVVAHFLAVVPKISIFSVLLNLILFSFVSLSEFLLSLFLVVSVLSIFIGSLGGIFYSRFSKIIAFSSVGQIGFVLLPFSSSSEEAILISTFYLIFYLLALSLFFIVWLNVKKTDSSPVTVYDLAGAHTQTFSYRLFLAFSVLSLAGMPPLVGFVSKFLVVKCLIEDSMVFSALVVLVLSVLAFVYYLRFIRIIFFIPAAISENVTFVASKATVCLGVLIVLLLVIFSVIIFIV